MQRRTALASTGGLAVTLLAGCLASGSDPSGGSPDDGSPSEDPPDDGDPSEDDVTPVVVDRTIETENTGCMSDEEDGVDVTFEADGVVLDGIAAAPTPCHEATIETAAAEDGTLRVAIGLEREGGVCAECVGAIEYAATIDLDGADGLDTVVVEHADPGGAHTVTRGEESPSPDGSDPDPPSHEDAMQQPDPDLPIMVENRHDEAHEIELTVTRESGETVYEATETVAPGEDREAYNLREAEPDGVEAFTIEARMGEETGSVEVETSACYGLVEVGVNEDGTLYPTYAIC